MEKSELVIELGVEEIPASMLEDAARQLTEFLVESLKAQRLARGGAGAIVHAPPYNRGDTGYSGVSG